MSAHIADHLERVLRDAVVRGATSITLHWAETLPIADLHTILLGEHTRFPTPGPASWLAVYDLYLEERQHKETSGA